MREQIPLWQPGEYRYPAPGSFVPTLTPYLCEGPGPKPAILLVPGGGYRYVSSEEGEMVAEAFRAMGYHAFVLIYTTNFLFRHPVRWQALNDLARAVRLVRAHAAEWNVDPRRVAACGFSAGGHLVGSLAVHFARPEILPDPLPCRLDAAVLCYPVVTMQQSTHGQSRRALLGDPYDEAEKELMSLEKQVAPETTPTMLWHTRTDETVPVENSILFAEALRKQGVPYALHLFPFGRHGMSLANERWAKTEHGQLITEQQFIEELRLAAAEGRVQEVMPSAPAGASFQQAYGLWQQRQHELCGDVPSPCVSQWPRLADAFFREVYAQRGAPAGS